MVQADPYNRSRLSTVVVVAVTTNQRLASMPGNVFLPAGEAGLPTDSVVNVTQAAMIDRAHLDSLVGVVPEWRLTEIDRGLRRVLAL